MPPETWTGGILHPYPIGPDIWSEVLDQASAACRGEADHVYWRWVLCTLAEAYGLDAQDVAQLCWIRTVDAEPWLTPWASTRGRPVTVRDACQVWLGILDYPRSRLTSRTRRRIEDLDLYAQAVRDVGEDLQ